MMNWFYSLLLGLPLLFGIFSGMADGVFSAVLIGAKEAVDTALGLTGGMMLFCGLLNILTISGVLDTVNRWMKKPLRFLFRDAPEEAFSFVTMNLSANLLGLGNAATPMGIEAARRLGREGESTNALCMFLVINAAGLQLLPSTVVALRQSMGAQDPGAVILPGILSTLVSCMAGVGLCLMTERIK